MCLSSLRRFAIGYILLVGLPLLGLIGNLRLGHKLIAPISVDGIWDITSIQDANGECAQSVAARDLAFTIIQSGKHLLISSSGDPMNSVDGQIQGERVTAVSLRLSPENDSGHSCGNIRLSLSASINSPRPVTMAGALSMDGCSSCPPLRFTALKRSVDNQVEKR